MKKTLAPAENAEKRMITNVPVARVGETIGDVEKMLLKHAKSFESIDYIYVLDGSRALKGVLSIKELFDAGNKGVRVEAIMSKKVVSVHKHTHQERVVFTALKHELKAVPVVEKDGTFLGVVPHCTILSIFNKEMHEDMFKFGGIFHKVGDEYKNINSSPKVMIMHRLPWLIIGTIAGSFIASMVGHFEETLSNLLVLASFMPVIVYLSDAVGTQSEAIAVINLAIEPKASARKHIAKEMVVALALATSCGALLSAIAAIVWGMPLVGAVVGISLFLSIMTAVITSTTLPFVFHRAGWDPAFASGPLATMISDTLTILIYFTVATVLMGVI